MLYRYVSVDASGKRHSGEIGALGPNEARRLITADGHLLISLKPAEARTWLRYEGRRDQSSETTAQFASELAGLLKAGAPLREALSIQADGAGPISTLARDILRDIENGGGLAQSLRAKPGATQALAEFAAAGEAGAGLAELLQQGGNFLTAREQAAKTIRSALAYPLFIGALGVVAIIALIVFVAPALAPILEDSDSGGLIRWLGGIGNWLQAQGSLISLALAGLVLLVWLATRSAQIQLGLRRLVWRLPVIGGISRDLSSGESMSVLAALLRVGRPLEAALDYSARVSSPVLRPCLNTIAERLRDGTPAGEAFAGATELPAEIRRLVRLGEHTSTLPDTLAQGAALCHSRAMARIEKLAAVAGPALVIGLGAGIALLMLSVLNSLMAIGGDTL